MSRDGSNSKDRGANVAGSPHPDLFLRACRREPVERTPVWIMRQAGRYLPEYRALREKVDFLTSCRTPEIACEITLQPIRRLGVDAAILFSDILIPLPGMGVNVEFAPGPRIDSPIRSREAIEALRVPEPVESMGFVMDAVKLVRKELAGRVPLIGFAGSPFTIATYLVEGGASKSFSAIKSLLVSDPALAHRLLTTCADTMAAYLSAQVRAGAQAAMLFDTWAGILSPEDYGEFALPYARRVFDAIAALDPSWTEPMLASREDDPPRAPAGEHPGNRSPSPQGTAQSALLRVGAPPRIYYAGDAAGHLDAVRGVGADVIGLDWRIGLVEARAILGPNLALQGNLDPTVLLGPRPVIEERTVRVLRQAKGERRLPAVDDRSVSPGPAAGHIFNLGHGILPETPPDHALFLIETVRRLSEIG